MRLRMPSYVRRRRIAGRRRWRRESWRKRHRTDRIASYFSTMRRRSIVTGRSGCSCSLTSLWYARGCLLWRFRKGRLCALCNAISIGSFEGRPDFQEVDVSDGRMDVCPEATHKRLCRAWRAEYLLDGEITQLVGEETFHLPGPATCRCREGGWWNGVRNACFVEGRL